MSDLFEAIKDALNPKRREQATVETYDPHTRGPYPDRPPAGGSQAQPESQAQPRAASAAQREEAQDAGRVERCDLSGGGGNSGSTAAGEESSGQGAKPASGTYGPHKSRVANALDPRVDSDRDGTASHGVGGYGGAAAKPLHTEGSNYGLS
ncbi:hypothetical protein MYCTH_2314369 [Thermothelomyces thermophilus ATCC 42464]|uniref:Uncharacterized protein n=1 Tax=Thermothelomyces thermophilus (strain ATCC 42464 / BCRC 31852 / DSM 1799) TaxID=573729 RepID=G2Q068_THET4|nr:uncharacterized protein MYCTH_2314369 [Thermothelomyces thermophilus ATCC 42464]AEO55742.1 hypothetical protein MYCTH_2314369 [Thermothelomyces thermophilus ATCC 42464]